MEFAIIKEITAPSVCDPDGSQFIFVVVRKTARSVGEQVSVEVVGEGTVCERAGDGVGGSPTQAVLSNCGEGVQAVSEGEAVFGEGGIGVKGRNQSIHGHV